MIQLELLPIVPILLFPFILVFFVVVFPFWLIGIGILGLLLVLARVAEHGLRLVRPATGTGLSSHINRAFRWVLTFGGLATHQEDDPE
ncbi:MAG TPA: hypothetical protein VMH39_08805 [Gemmatimonadaceae bacterium]|nr:hypothetical protein [Gemmatimonadaceae bacterium]